MADKDIRIIWDNELTVGDIRFLDGDLVRENALTTAVLMSLFTDRFDSNEENREDDEKRGWWGDNLSEEGDVIGSRLWLLERAKATTDTVVLVKAYILEALQWMIDDELAVSIEVTAERHGNPNGDRLFVLVVIRKQSGAAEALKWDDFWSAQFTQVEVAA